MYPYQNPDLSTEERISDLMSRMTLEERSCRQISIIPAILQRRTKTARLQPWICSGLMH